MSAQSSRPRPTRQPGPSHTEEVEHKRGRRPEWVDIVQLNSSGIPQLKKALEHYAGKGQKEGEEACEVAMLACQEHHAAGVAWTDLQHYARGQGWNLQGAKATPGEAGAWSSGTGIAVKSKIGMGRVGGLPHDISPPGSEGKVSVCWADGVLRGGILCVSVYLWHTEGLSERNCQILEAAGKAVCQHGGAWCIIGDFNMTAEQLLAGMGHWVTRIGGKINAPKEFTCRSRNGGRTIDYAIFDERISSAVVSTWVDFGCTSNPHKAVRHRLRASGSRDQVRQLRKPKAFPLWKPMGCPRAPRVPRPEVVEVLKKEDVTMKDVSHAFEHLMELAEEELCGLCDMVEEDGTSCKKYTGRSRPKFEWGATVPTRGKEVGRADPATLGLQWLGRAFLDMAGILRLVHRGAPATGVTATARPLTDALARQWAALQSQLTNTKTTVQAAMRDASPVWRWRVSAATLITATTDTSVDAARVLQEWGKEACQEAKERG